MLHGAASMNPPKQQLNPTPCPDTPGASGAAPRWWQGGRRASLWASQALKEVRGLCLCLGKVEEGGMSGSSVGFPLEQSIHLQ